MADDDQAAEDLVSLQFQNSVNASELNPSDAVTDHVLHTQSIISVLLYFSSYHNPSTMRSGTCAFLGTVPREPRESLPEPRFASVVPSGRELCGTMDCECVLYFR